MPILSHYRKANLRTHTKRSNTQKRRNNLWRIVICSQKDQNCRDVIRYTLDMMKFELYFISIFRVVCDIFF